MAKVAVPSPHAHALGGATRRVRHPLWFGGPFLVLGGILVARFWSADLPIAVLLLGVAVHVVVAAAAAGEALHPAPIRLPVYAVLVAYGVWSPTFSATSPNLAVLRWAPPADAYTRSLLATLLFTLAFAGGQWVLRPRQSPIAGVSSTTRPPLRQMMTMGVGLAVLSGASLLIYGLTSGLPLSAFFVTSGSSIDRAQVNLGPQFLFAGVDFGVPACALLLAEARLRGRAISRAFIAAVLPIGWLFFALGFRYRVVMLGMVLILIAAGIPRRTRKRPSRVRRVVGGVTLAAVAVGSFAATSLARDRDSEQTRQSPSALTMPEVADVFARAVLLSGPYEALIAQREATGYLSGRSYTELPLLAMPTILYPDKPRPAIIGRIEAVARPNVGAAIPLWGEADENFDLVGVIVLGIGSCLVLHIVGRRGSIASLDLIIASVAGVTLANVLTRSVIFWAAWQFVVTVGPLLILRRLARKRLRVGVLGTTRVTAPHVTSH